MSLAWELVAETSITGSAITQVDFTGISFTSDDTLMLVSTIYNPTGSTSSYRLCINSNTTLTNYYAQQTLTNSTTKAGSRVNAPTFALNATSDYLVNNTIIKLSENDQFNFNAINTRDVAGTTPSIESYAGVSTFTATNITEINIVASIANSIGIGSNFKLYKCVAELIGDETVSTATSSVSFGGLNMDVDGEYMLISYIVENGSTGGDINLVFNTETTLTNYYYQQLSANSTTVAGERDNKPRMSYIIGSSTTFNITYIKVTNNNYFTWQSRNLLNINTPSTIRTSEQTGASTTPVSTVTAITMYTTVTNDIAIGSRFQLYKMK